MVFDTVNVFLNKKISWYFINKIYLSKRFLVSRWINISIVFSSQQIFSLIIILFIYLFFLQCYISHYFITRIKYMEKKPITFTKINTFRSHSNQPPGPPCYWVLQMLLVTQTLCLYYTVKITTKKTLRR